MCDVVWYIGGCGGCILLQSENIMKCIASCWELPDRKRRRSIESTRLCFFKQVFYAKMINGIKNIVNYKPDTTNVCTLRNAGSNEGVGAKGNLLQSKKAPTSFITEPPSLSAGWMRAEENREPRKLERGLESSRGESLERQAASGDAVAAELPSRGASLHSPRWPTETCCARSPQLSCSFVKN